MTLAPPGTALAFLGGCREGCEEICAAGGQAIADGANVADLHRSGDDRPLDAGSRKRSYLKGRLSDHYADDLLLSHGPNRRFTGASRSRKTFGCQSGAPHRLPQPRHHARESPRRGRACPQLGLSAARPTRRTRSMSMWMLRPFAESPLRAAHRCI